MVYASEQLPPRRRAALHRARAPAARGRRGGRHQTARHLGLPRRPSARTATRFWQLRRRVPVLTVVVDTPANIARWYADRRRAHRRDRVGHERDRPRVPRRRAGARARRPAPGAARVVTPQAPVSAGTRPLRIASAVAPIGAHPAEEDVARRLHPPLPLDDPAPLIGVAAAAGVACRRWRMTSRRSSSATAPASSAGSSTRPRSRACATASSRTWPSRASGRSRAAAMRARAGSSRTSATGPGSPATRRSSAARGSARWPRS